MLVCNVHRIFKTDRRTYFSNFKRTCSRYEILCLSETWHTESISKKALLLENFKMYRNDSHRGCTKHGGEHIAVTRTINSSEVITHLSDGIIVRILRPLPILKTCICSGPKQCPHCWTSEQFLDCFRTIKHRQYELKAHNGFIDRDINLSSTDWHL